jgi:hypothetical protein
MLANLLHDVRYSLHGFASRPMFAATVVLAQTPEYRSEHTFYVRGALSPELLLAAVRGLSRASTRASPS